MSGSRVRDLFSFSFFDKVDGVRGVRDDIIRQKGEGGSTEMYWDWVLMGYRGVPLHKFAGLGVGVGVRVRRLNLANTKPSTKQS